MSFYQREEGYYEFDVPIGLREGLHFRPIIRVNETAGPFDGRLVVGKLGGGQVGYVDARSPMELLTLVGVCGETLRFRLGGVEEAIALEAYRSLLGILGEQ